jgi:hypothetical protein
MSHTHKAGVLFLLILLIATTAFAQKVIKGTVTDAETGEKLISTNLLIEDSYRGTITNDSGAYSITIPDSLLPATVLVRYIGYQSEQRKITAESASQQNFALQPSVTEMEEVVVTGEDPGITIMREVIERKQQWRQQLDTYRAEAYTRQTLSNDTSIVSITESSSEVFWDDEQGHREVLKSKRQTANIEAGDNFAGVSYLPNFYDDNIDIAGFEVVGVTHPDALNYYDFKLVDQTSLDDQTVFEIEVLPARKLQPLFKGTVYVLDEAYALLRVNLVPNDVINFPRPVQSVNLSYKQQFNNYGQDFWLPADVRIAGDVKISMVGLDFPQIKFKQLSRITNYQVNTALPDSLYDQENTFSVDSTTISSDSLITRQVDTVPLSDEEQTAYTTLDSTMTLEKAFKPSGFLAGFVDDDGEDNSGSGLIDFMDQVPGNISPNARYNRVDQLYAGLQYSIDATDWLTLRAKGGYSTGYEQWNYGGGLSLQWLDQPNFEATLGSNYAAQTATRMNSPIYKPYYTIIPNLLGNRGYFDYYRSEGFRTFSSWELPRQDLSLEIGFSSRDHSSLTTNTAYDLLGESNFRTNPPIQEGRLQAIDIDAGYNLDEGYNFGVTGQKFIRFGLEHSSDKLGSDFNYTKYSGHISWTFPTFYQRRLLSNSLDVNLRGGTYSGDLPFQKLGIIDAAIGQSAPYGVMKAARNRPYEGQQYLALNLEHNFRTIPFEALGLTSLVERNIGLIVFGGVAKTWGPDWNPTQLALRTYIPNGTDGTHLEAGASLNGILGLFRLDVAARIDQPALLVNISVARLF